MSEWREMRIGELAANTRNALVGGPFGSNLVSADYTTDGVPVIRGQNMGCRWVSGEFAYVSPEKAQSLQANLARPGDIVFTQRGTLGQVALVPEGSFDSYVVSQGQMKLTVDRAKADPRFLFYVFSSPSQQEYIRQNAIQVGVPHTNLGILRDTPVSLPSLDEQHTIAHILGTLDDKIELNRCINETLEAIARAMFKSWFVDFDPVRAKMSGEPPESICQRLGLTPDLLTLFPDRLVDSELGDGWPSLTTGIPKGWDVGTLGDVAQHPRRGIQPSQIATATPYIALEHMPRRCIALSDWDVADNLESNKFEFKKGEILFGKLRPYFHKVGVAPVDGVCSTDIVVITPKTDEWFGFVLGYVSSEAFVEHTNAGSTGTKMPRTSWSDMSRYQIVMPPKEIAEAFTNFVRPAIERITASIHEARTLAVLRDILLPKLLSTELRVPDAEKTVELMA